MKLFAPLEPHLFRSASNYNAIATAHAAKI